MLEGIFKDVTTEYNDKIFNIFKKLIDDTKEKCKKDRKDIIETYIEVNKIIEDGFNNLMEAQDVKDINFDLMNKVYLYIDDIIQAAKKQIQYDAQTVLDSVDLGSLKENYEKLMSEIEKIDSKLELNVMDVFEDIEIDHFVPVDGKQLKLTKDIKKYKDKI